MRVGAFEKFLAAICALRSDILELVKSLMILLSIHLLHQVSQWTWLIWILNMKEFKRLWVENQLVIKVKIGKKMYFEILPV